MIEVLKTQVFDHWYRRLRDVEAKGRIDARIRRLSLGNFGDVKSVGGGVAEIRVRHGPGYRVYFLRQRPKVVILLCGGDKGSQRRDIARAQKLAKDYFDGD